MDLLSNMLILLFLLNCPLLNTNYIVFCSNDNCRWTVTNPNGKIHADVIISDVEDGDPTSCFDKYTIYDGSYLFSYR